MFVCVCACVYVKRGEEERERGEYALVVCVCVKQGGGGEREGGVCISSMCVCELCAYTHTLNVCVHMRNIIIPPVILLQSNYNLRSLSTHTYSAAKQSGVCERSNTPSSHRPSAG